MVQFIHKSKQVFLFHSTLKSRINLLKMQRFLKNYGNLNKTSESIVSNDYNWDELSIGEDTLGGDRFFGNILYTILNNF